MKAAQFIGEPLFAVAEVADPPCPVDGLLVRVDSTAICGTDLKIMQCQDVKIEKGEVTTMELPRITGHEISGVVERAGDEVGGFQRGDRVAVGPTVPCLHCAMCERHYLEMCENVQVIGYHRDGGFAELIRLDGDVLAAGCVVKVPENVSLEAAALTEPLSCAINCLELSAVRPDGSVLIIGAGPLGLIIADLACHQGARQVVVADISPEQLDKAGVCHATAFVNMVQEDLEEAVNRLTGGLGADLVVTACAAPEAQQLALKVVGRRGAVNFFGGLPRDRATVPMETNLIHYKEISVVGTHGSSPRHIARAVGLQAEGAMDLATYIDCSYPLEKINEALKVAQGKPRLKILVAPNV